MSNNSKESKAKPRIGFQGVAYGHHIYLMGSGVRRKYEWKMRHVKVVHVARLVRSRQANGNPSDKPLISSGARESEDDGGGGGGSSSSSFSCSIPGDVQDIILATLPLIDLLQCRSVSKYHREVVHRRTFQVARSLSYPTEFSLSPVVFYVNDEEVWSVLGFDINAQTWRRLPPLKMLPAPDPELFKDFLVAGGVGLFCVNAGKSPDKEKLIICNPLTQEVRNLPPLNFPRHPVVMCVHVNLTANTYTVIVAGSSGIGTEKLSKKTEIYNSVEKEWVTVGDVPGPDFGLNEYQTGSYCERWKILFCIGFLSGGGKGILAFHVEKREWLHEWRCTLPSPSFAENRLITYFAITQLVVCNGMIYLFSEQEFGRDVKHCIHMLNFEKEGGDRWTRVVEESRKGIRALLVYPEYCCVPQGIGRLCIFNTIERTGDVYEIQENVVVKKESLPQPPSSQIGVMFHSLNPIGYTFEPSFGVSV